jgi:hypothetical protein
MNIKAFILLPLITLHVYSEETTQAEDDLIKRIEPGSIIKDFLLPNYDENKSIISVQRIKKLKFETESKARAENISLHYIKKTTENSLAPVLITAEKAYYDAQSKLLRSENPVKIESPNYKLLSNGVVADLNNNKVIQVFLLPPVYGFITPKEKPKQAMNITKKSLLIATSVASTLHATPEAPTAEQLKLLDLQRKSVAEFDKENEKQKMITDSSIEQNQISSDSLKKFATTNRIELPQKGTQKEIAEIDTNKPVEPVTTFPQFQASAKSIGVTCSGGAFFDSKTSTLTLLKDITVRDPFSAMTAKDELKLLMGSKPKKTVEKNAATTGKKPKESTVSDNFSEIIQISAFGGVTFEITDKKDGKKTYISGDTFVYDKKTEDILIKGQQIILQKSNESRAESRNPNAWLIINKVTQEPRMSEGWTFQMNLAKP